MHSLGPCAFLVYLGIKMGWPFPMQCVSISHSLEGAFEHASVGSINGPCLYTDSHLSCTPYRARRQHTCRTSYFPKSVFIGHSRALQAHAA